MNFDLGLAIKTGWETAKTNFFFFLGILAILFVATFISSAVSSSLTTKSPFLSSLIDILQMLINLILGIGLIKISLKFVDGQKPTFPDLYQNISAAMVAKYLIGSLLCVLVALIASAPGLVILLALLATTKSYLLSLLVGLLAILIGVIYTQLRLGQFKYPIVDRSAKILESLKYSWTITDGNVAKLLLFTIEIAGIVILGFLLIGIGLLWAIPTVLVASAHIYRQLEKLNNNTVVQQPSTAPQP